MKHLINEFLKQQELHPGQIYKICPNVFLKDFLKFSKEYYLKQEMSKILDRRPIRKPGEYEEFLNLQ